VLRARVRVFLGHSISVHRRHIIVKADDDKPGHRQPRYPPQLHAGWNGVVMPTHMPSVAWHCLLHALADGRAEDRRWRSRAAAYVCGSTLVALAHSTHTRTLHALKPPLIIELYIGRRMSAITDSNDYYAGWLVLARWLCFGAFRLAHSSLVRSSGVALRLYRRWPSHAFTLLALRWSILRVLRAEGLTLAQLWVRNGWRWRGWRVSWAQARVSRRALAEIILLWPCAGVAFELADMSYSVVGVTCSYTGGQTRSGSAAWRRQYSVARQPLKTFWCGPSPGASRA